MLKKILSHPIAYPLIIVALGIFAYANSLKAPFTLDDLTSITENLVIRDIANYLPGGAGYDFVPRRWVGYFTFALNYHFGALDVTGYHLFNLAVHLCTALLVYALVALTFRTPHLAGSRIVRHSRTVALFASLLFVVHPVQTQSVTYIVQRLTSLSTLFYLLSAVCYVAARLRIDSKAEAHQGGGKTILLVTGSFAAAILAMQTKEIAFTLPFALVLYEFSFFRGEWKKRALYLLPLLLTLPIIPLATLFAGGEGVDPASPGGEDPLRAQTDMPRLHYLLTQFRVIVTYLRLLVLPVNQNLDYDYPVYKTFFTPPVFLSFLFLAALIALAVYLHFRSAAKIPAPAAEASRDPAVRLISFGIFWFFLTLAVESSLVPIFDVIFEHRLYLPSVGLFAAFSALLLLVSEKTLRTFEGRIPLVAASLIVLALAVATVQRNHIWSSSVRLWVDVAGKSPGKARPWYNLGCYLSDAGRFDESRRALLLATQIDPQHADAWHNLGRVYLLMGRSDEAVPVLRNAVRLQPDLYNATVNLSVALIQQGQALEAIPLLHQLLKKFPDWPQVRANLCAAYINLGDYAAAQRELTVLYQLSPQQAAPLAERLRRSTGNSAAP